MSLVSLYNDRSSGARGLGKIYSTAQQSLTYENSRRAMNHSSEISQETDRRVMKNSAGKYGEKC